MKYFDERNRTGKYHVRSWRNEHSDEDYGGNADLSESSIVDGNRLAVGDFMQKRDEPMAWLYHHPAY